MVFLAFILLKSLNILTGIVTSTSAESLQKDLRRYVLPSAFLDYIQTEDDTKFHKPDSKVFDPLMKWLSQHDITDQQVLYVGDGLHDMKAAQNSNFRFIGVTTGLITSEEFDKHGVISANGLSDLLEFLD